MMQKKNLMVEMLNVTNKKDSEKGHDTKVNEILKDFKIKTEKEFEAVLMSDWNIIVCSCENKIDILTAKYTLDGEIICSKCGRVN